MRRRDPMKPADKSGTARLRAAPRRLLLVGRALRDPALWSRRRMVGEGLLALVLTLLAWVFTVFHHGVAVAVLCAVGVAALGLLRRVMPAPVLLIATVASLPLGGFDVLVPIAAWSVGRRVGSPVRASATVALALAVMLGEAVADSLPHFSGPYAAFAFLTLLVVTAVPAFAGRYWAQRRTLADTLHEYRAQIVRENHMIANEARLRERQRIARDMHDSLGHQLALISVRAGALEVDAGLAERHRESVGVLREASVAAMRELREVVGLLRDGVEPDSGTAGAKEARDGAPRLPDAEGGRGVEGVERLTDASRAAGTAVRLLRTGDPRPLAPAAGHAAYRAVQEGLTNVLKHAPGAPVTVELRYEPDSLVVEVANGPSSAHPAARDRRAVVSGGRGLTGLTERLRLVGGMVHTAPTDGGGFRLAAVLPYVLPKDPVPDGAYGTTFVAGTGDFREQPGAAPLGDIGAVNRTDLAKDVARAMSRDNRRKGLAVGCGVAVAVALLLGVAAAVGGYFLFKEADKAMIEPEEYAAVSVGMSEAEVRDRLPRGDSFLADGLDKGAPAEPAGATCLSLNSSEIGSSWDKSPVFRFCFRDGRLVEKKTFEIKG
ncbi:sensor histidine kinase [Streptomyces sp. NPDC101178]|uniref:sensor histidine kinase n=1 Tax=Streptomyces sp. NPDC101178 TaxID=3366124 RepID=UPI0038102247